ncbi:hypothetical protein D1007_41566 [Hordeum vulgare]|nr:hypothetical protein D1007_41566 [Hordeum vulgare]
MASNSIFTELLRNYKLDGTNFTVWKRKMMFLLTAENIEYVVSTAEPNKPDDDASDEEKDNYSEELKEWNKDNKRARIFILGSMSDSLAGEYETEVAAHRIMRQLEKDFGEVSLIKVLSLLNRFLTSKMADNTSVNEHLNKLCVLNEELKNAGYPFSEEVQVMVALNSLPHTWEQFKISFCHSERLLNMRNLRHHLLMEEDRKTSQGKERHSHHQELHLGGALSQADPFVVLALTEMLDEHNPYVQLYRTARQRLRSADAPDLAIQFFGHEGVAHGDRYSGPTVPEVAALIVATHSAAAEAKISNIPNCASANKTGRIDYLPPELEQLPSKIFILTAVTQEESLKSDFYKFQVKAVEHVQIEEPIPTLPMLNIPTIPTASEPANTDAITTPATTEYNQGESLSPTMKDGKAQ